MKPLLLTDWNDQDPTGWFMSEKIDGWRIMWDGEKFITRQNKVMNAPKWFCAGMPNTPLDGELFAGRGEFNFIQSMISNGWIGLTFQIFDAPSLRQGYADRHLALHSLDLPCQVKIIDQTICEGLEHLQSFTRGILAQSGEGSVIREPKSEYKSGRCKLTQRIVPRPPEFSRRMR